MGNLEIKYFHLIFLNKDCLLESKTSTSKFYHQTLPVLVRKIWNPPFLPIRCTIPCTYVLNAHHMSADDGNCRLPIFMVETRISMFLCLIVFLFPLTLSTHSLLRRFPTIFACSHIFAVKQRFSFWSQALHHCRQFFIIIFISVYLKLLAIFSKIPLLYLPVLWNYVMSV